MLCVDLGGRRIIKKKNYLKSVKIYKISLIVTRLCVIFNILLVCENKLIKGVKQV